MALCKNCKSYDKDFKSEPCSSCNVDEHTNFKAGLINCKKCVNFDESEYCYGCEMGSLFIPLPEELELDSKAEEMVYHPNHYNQSGRRECWDEMIDIFGSNAVAIFDILSAYKYYYRAGNKAGNSEAQDKAKINNYINHSSNIMIEKLSEQTALSENNKLAMDCIVKMKTILKEG